MFSVGFFAFLSEQIQINMILKWWIVLTAFAYHATLPHEPGNPDPLCPDSFHGQVFCVDDISFQAPDVPYLDERDDCRE